MAERQDSCHEPFSKILISNRCSLAKASLYHLPMNLRKAPTTFLSGKSDWTSFKYSIARHPKDKFTLSMFPFSIFSFLVNVDDVVK